MQAPASWLPLARTIAIATAIAAVWPGAAYAQRDSIPSQSYYVGVEELYRGELRDAQRTFNRGLTGAVKTVYEGGTIRWIDSICYHAMLGETYYHWGQPEQALQQFNFACSLYLQYPRWMMRVQFEPQPVADVGLARLAVPWGVSQRGATPGRFASAISVAQGQLDNSQAVQQGGVLQQAQYWPINVVEVLRCTALAIRRRNEILGALGPHDSISKNLVANLSRGGAPPNHWSNAWVDLNRGLALIGVGNIEQGLQLLDRGTLVAGQFDHPLTCIALLEQGRLALDAGNFAAAGSLLAEASYSAYQYEDAGVIYDAFRWSELNRIAADAGDVNPALNPAAVWARRERVDLLTALLSFTMADELMTLGEWKNAAAALAAGASQLGDARTGVLGNWAMFLDAKLQYQQGRNTAANVLAAALDGQRKISLQNFQINLANSMFDSQALPTRTAPTVYEVLLADPTALDAALRPLETMGVMTTSHEPAFERWLLATLERKNIAATLEVTERAKRRRLHNALPWGGRLAALRDILAAPPNQLAPTQQQLQNDLRARFPEFSDVAETVDRLHAELDKVWRPPLDEGAQKKTAQLWQQYADALRQRENLLTQIGLSRAPAEMVFPPMRTAAELQQNLQPGQALLVYHDTPEGLLGLLVTAKAASHWNCGPSARIGALVSQFLRDLGNHDAGHEMSVEELSSNDWQTSGGKLFDAMFNGSSLAPSAVSELIVVPDGITWYVPFEALVADVEGQTAPLVTFAKIRQAPTAGLAFSFDGAWRRVQRTGIVAGGILPGDKDEQARAEAATPLQAAVSGPVVLSQPLPAPSPVVASLLDELIVMENVETQADHPLAWSPLPLDKNEQQGALEQWLALPKSGPQRIALPGMHTLAERSGKTASRRRGATVAPGDDLFYASCGLMSAGAETMLLSRWRVGGQSTLDLVREFVQELPHTAAAEAWQRSVQLAMQMPLDPLNELRVKAGKDAVELTAAHPFFWAGYLVIDSGWRPEEEPVEAEGEPQGEGEAPAEPPMVEAEKPAAGGPAADAKPAPPPEPKPPVAK